MLIQFNAESGTVGNQRMRRSEIQRLGDQIGYMIKRADRVGWKRVGVDFRKRSRNMQHGGSSDSEFQIAPNRAAKSRRSGHGYDVARCLYATMLAGVNAQNIGRAVNGNLSCILQREDAFVGHNRSRRITSKFGKFKVADAAA